MVCMAYLHGTTYAMQHMSHGICCQHMPCSTCPHGICSSAWHHICHAAHGHMTYIYVHMAYKCAAWHIHPTPTDYLDLGVLCHADRLYAIWVSNEYTRVPCSTSYAMHDNDHMPCTYAMQHISFNLMPCTSYAMQHGAAWHI